jgi:sporulation protein YlmC with PRC-barrel domain
VVEVIPMKAPTYAVLMTFLAVAVAQAQQVQSESPTNSPQATAPIMSIDNVALGGSARVSKLIGSKVYQGDMTVGQIEDILVDLNHSKLTAVVLSVGGFLGVGEKLVAVSVDQIKVGTEAKFTTDLTKEQMTNAPAFDFGKLK